MTPADIISHPTQITLLDVMLWDSKVGALVATQNGYKKQICFYFDPSFVKSGYDIAPLRASITGNIAKNGFPVYPESDKLFGGLPSFIADSLPDHWGNLVFKEWAKQNGIRTKDLNALDRLAYIGRRGMDRVVSIDKSWTEHRSACAVSASCGHQPIPDWHLTLDSTPEIYVYIILIFGFNCLFLHSHISHKYSNH